MEKELGRLQLAGQRPLPYRPEWPLNDVRQPAMGQGPVWIVEPPLSTGERMSVNDPDLTFRVPNSGR